MLTNEQLQEQIEDIRVTLSVIRRKLEEIDDFTQTHAGFDWGNAYSLDPHPSLSSESENMPMPPLVSSDSWHCLGTQIAAGASGPAASATYPTANMATYIPLLVTEDITVVKLWVLNGSAVSGNIDMGIYDSSFVRKISIGSTAQAGISVMQEFNISDTLLEAGQYYIALAMDNTTGAVFRYTDAVAAGQITQSWGVASQGSAFPLPATATLADISNANIPLCGIATRSQVA
jgi:hypothetical protein